MAKGLSDRPQDTARRLIAEFGTLGAVLRASPSRLLSVSGGDAAAVQEVTSFRCAMTTALRSRVYERPLLPGSTALIDYLRFEGAWLLHEQIRLLHLNAAHFLIRDEVLNEGSVSEAELHVREVVRRALELGSVALILVHNHPSGNPEPSDADIKVTRKVASACQLFAISLMDHMIVAAEGHSSFRALGLL